VRQPVRHGAVPQTEEGDTGPACELDLELVHGKHSTGEDGDHGRVNEKDQGRWELNVQLTWRTRAWS
jgi:hypothetical protein